MRGSEVEISIGGKHIEGLYCREPITVYPLHDRCPPIRSVSVSYEQFEEFYLWARNHDAFLLAGGTTIGYTQRIDKPFGEV
jgi:hypothetical protein